MLPSQKLALRWPFYLLSVCASFCQYLLITNTAIFRTHAAPAHGGFLSRASWGCLSRLSKSSPASPFLCGCQPAHQWYFPECPHCTTGGMAPQFYFLSEIPRHRGWRVWGPPQRRTSAAIVSEHLSCVVCETDFQSPISPQPVVISSRKPSLITATAPSHRSFLVQ